MSTKTEDALERLRMGITHFTGAVETADIRTALAEIERLTANFVNYVDRATDDHIAAAATARAAGYEAGQRAMRERAAKAALNARAPMVECWPACKAVDDLPILPEPQEGQP